jgi:hypothetical protein
VVAAWRDQGPGRRWILPLLSLFTGLLNSVLILLFYSVGCVKAQRVLNSQLAFLKTLPQPLSVEMPKFRSNRIWLRRNGIDFEEVSSPPPPPRMVLKKSATRVALPPDWRSQVPPDFPVELWKKENLLQEIR